tara:strand:+ start:108 stop:668 length:561 start_codon:yes stop_codon:yes gene_type:complete
MANFFIEIGTSDFNTLEYLAENGWKGIFVEPVKELLDNLKRYDGCIYENCAISSKRGSTTIKYYDPNWATGWIRGVGSIDMGMNIMNSNPNWKEHECTRKVKIMTLDDLIKKHNVKEIEYLKIDTEGEEYNILHSYSWSIKPEQLNIEYKHWHNRFISVDSFLERLKDMGYKCNLDKENITAVLEK